MNARQRRKDVRRHGYLLKQVSKLKDEVHDCMEIINEVKGLNFLERIVFAFKPKTVFWE